MERRINYAADFNERENGNWREDCITTADRTLHRRRSTKHVKPPTPVPIIAALMRPINIKSAAWSGEIMLRQPQGDTLGWRWGVAGEDDCDVWVVQIGARYALQIGAGDGSDRVEAALDIVWR